MLIFALVCLERGSVGMAGQPSALLVGLGLARSVSARPREVTAAPSRSEGHSDQRGR